MNKILVIFLLSLMSNSSIYAQGLGYDSKKEIGNGLYKVKSGPHYGIIDDKDDVVVSVEFQDILFREGRALLIKDDMLYGVVDSLGKVRSFEPKYKVHPKFRYVYEGYIIVGDSKWGYLSEDGTPLLLDNKSRNTFISQGAFTFLKRSFTIFDDAYPFVDGVAAVYFKKTGWKHIDKAGKERFILSNKKIKSEFRSSVYKDECIIVTDEGIKQYQENDDRQAVVKLALSTSASKNWNNMDIQNSKIVYNEGTLVLDSLMRVSKFKTNTDSIIFIDTPKPVIPEPEPLPIPDSLSVKDDINVELLNKNVQANGKGKAYIEVKMENKSVQKFENLIVSLKCGITTRKWSGFLEGKSEIHLSLNIPASFSTAQIKRTVIVQIEYNDEYVEYKLPLTIKRYTPIRSR